MDEQKPTIENESDIAKQVEDKDLQLEAGLEKLERPPNDDFIAGLKNFVAWVKSLLDK